ncbi:MAG: hypothetical protein ACI81L_000782 [Verrucomicrobiales bacterium]|jgi:hypothetical protein
MLDHVFADAIGALRSAMELAMLERQAVEERFTTDALVGDTRWETSYSIPGQGVPPRVQADMTLLWPTWSQTAYRRWFLSGELAEIPAIEAELVVRAQRLSEPPNPATVLQVLPEASPVMGRNMFERVEGATVETIYGEDLSHADYAIEVSYLASFELHTDLLVDGNLLDEIFCAAGGWISSTLVILSDAV